MLTVGWALARAADGEAPADEVTVTGEAPGPGDGAARVTVVDPRALPASADVATAAARAPGVVVRRLGGLGDPAEIGLRGSGARHTEVLLDGVPLNPEGSAALDPTDLPLAALDRVEVWRGAGPTPTGTPALGGAVALWTRRDPVRQGALSVGSRGAARATAVAGAGPALLVVDGLATGGRFRWYDDGGTRGEPADDRLRARENNDHARLATVARVALGPVELLHVGVAREDGVPGFTFDPARAVRWTLHRHLVGATARGALGSGEATARAYGLVRAERLDDPLGELGLGGPGGSATTLGSVGLDGALRAPLSPRVRAELSAGGRVDAAPVAGRRMARASAGLPLAAGDLDLWPVVSALAVSDAAPLVLPRLGARWRSLSATAGLAGRPPDLVELHGDRGAMVGNPDLRAERGVSGDLGLAGSAAGASGAVVVFASRLRDPIVWIPTPQGVARPENVDAAAVLGLEAAGSLGGAGAGLDANATLLDARRISDDPTYAGNRLPRVPVAEALLAARAAAGPWRGALDLSLTSRTFADAANLRPEAARVLLGAGLGFDPPGPARLDLDVRNVVGTRTARVPRDPLVDDGVLVRQPLQDFGGYPLPGRQALLTLTVDAARPEGSR